MSENVSAPVSSTPTAPAQSTPAPQSGSTIPDAKAQAASPSAPEVFDVKVNGKMIKMSRQEVLDHASMSHAAQSKFEEAAATRKQVDKILATAKSNPIEALMDPSLGLSKDQIRDAFEKWYTKEFIEPDTLTPEQKKLKEYEAKLKTYEETEKEKKQREEQDQQEKLTTQQREYLQNQIVQAMEASGLPKTKFFASRMAFYMRQNLMNGWEAPIDMIVTQVKNERQGMMSDLVQNSDAQTLINLLGEDVINKIRQHDLKQLRERRNAQAPSYGGKSANPSPQSGDKVYSSDVNRKLREMRTGKSQT